MTNVMAKAQKFLKEIKSEMSKVTWPSFTELKGSTILVIIVSVFFAVYIGLVDFILVQLQRFF